MLSKIINYINIQLKLFSVLLQKEFRKIFSEQHQLTSTTSYDRYPEIFSEIKKLSEKCHPIILSYGSSTGEECFTLRNYFPNATIIGADINKNNLRIANRKNYDPAIHFIYSTRESLVTNGPYDIIFAMSVLCRWEDTKNLQNCEKVYPFAKFDNTVNLLYSLLNKNGFLVVYNANFRIEESSLHKKLTIIETPDIKDSGFVYKFDRSNNRVLSPHKTVIYKKIS